VSRDGVATSWPLHTRIDGLPCVLEAPYVELPDGRLGWWQRGRDCFKASVSTMVQVPYDEIGPMETLGDLYEWAERRGLTVEIRVPVMGPLPQFEGLWVGIFTPEGYDDTHTFVARGPELYLDPAVGMFFPDGLPDGTHRAPLVTPAEIQSAELAITIPELEFAPC
jgi:hypothetical protein